MMKSHEQSRESWQELSDKLKESDERAKKARAEADEREKKARAESDEREKKARAEADKREKKARAEADERMDKYMADLGARLDKSVGRLGNSVGRLVETMFSAELWQKFSDLGYTFTQQAERVQFTENRQFVAEADVFLENGEYAMVVEIKTNLTNEDVDDHLQRIETIRRYFDARNDSRKLIGAIAGGVMPKNAMKYALKKGLYIITQSGDAVTIAELPPGFKLREW